MQNAPTDPQRCPQAEAALRQQHDLLAVTLQSIGDAVVTTDAQGRITFLNPVAEALTGWPLADALGQAFETVCPLVHAQTRHPVESPVAQVLRVGTGVVLAPQTVLVTRDGRDVLIADSSAPIRSADETLHGRFCRKFSFKVICGMVSPSNPCCQGGERRWRSASKGPIFLTTLF